VQSEGKPLPFEMTEHSRNKSKLFWLSFFSVTITLARAARLLAFFCFDHSHCERCEWPWGHYDIYSHLQNANSRSVCNGNGGTLNWGFIETGIVFQGAQAKQQQKHTHKKNTMQIRNLFVATLALA
jgi:hypothetical protein